MAFGGKFTLIIVTENDILDLMRFSVYILKCSDNTYYVGCTNNLEQRLKLHNESKNGAHYTKIRRPVILIYKEGFDNLASARSREAEIKRLSRQQKDKLLNTIKVMD